MNYPEKFQEAKKAGYSDQEIMQFLGEKDPTFNEKFKKAQDEGYNPNQIFGYLNKSEEKEPDMLKDFASQTLQGGGIGALGTYGDILDLFGLQAKEINPAEKEKYSREFQILEKMQKGEVPSYGEFLDLSSDEPVPRFSRFPSSKDVEELGTELNLVTEPKTAAGRYGKRIGKLGGGGVALGGTGILAPIAAGIAGQTLEEMGAPPWVQAAAEIIASLKFAPKSATNISSKSPEVEKTIKDLRKAGFKEEDITLAKNALEERKILKKYASLTPEAENSINQGLKNSEELLKEQIKKGLPGYAEGGLPYLEKQASNVYQTMEDLASSISVKNKEPARKAIQESISYLEKYPLLKEQKEFIDFLKDGLNKIDGGNTAEFFTGFYRNLGKAGNWGNPKQKEHLLGMVQKGIKETFKESGPEAAKFGKYFDKTNESWKQWLNTRDLMQTLEKAQTTEGTNFKKLASILNDPENIDLAKKVLGPQQVENIKIITKGADAIESLLKQIPKDNKTIQTIKILEAVRSIVTGDYKTLGGIITLDAAKKLSTSMLIDPEKQNIMKKLIVAAKNNSPQQAMILAQELLNKKDSSQAKVQKDQQQHLIK